MHTAGVQSAQSAQAMEPSGGVMDLKVLPVFLKNHVSNSIKVRGLL